MLPQSPQDPRSQTTPVTHILNNKSPLFGLILVHMGVLGKRGTGENRASGAGAVQGQSGRCLRRCLGGAFTMLVHLGWDAPRCS